MTAVTEQLLDEMVRVIVREIDPEQVYLFGSRARGDARADSDVDLLVVEQEPPSNPGSCWGKRVRLSHLLAQFRVSTDVLVYSHAEVERWRASTNHVVARALREGKLLYERH
jgi:predicted nucleotidyltransferase